MYYSKAKYKHIPCWVFGTSLLLLQLSYIQQTTAYSSSEQSEMFKIKMSSVPFGINNVIGQGQACYSDLACGWMCLLAKDCKVAVYNPAHTKCLLTCAPPKFGYNVADGMVSMERADEVAVNKPCEIAGFNVGAAFHMYGQVLATPEKIELNLSKRDGTDLTLGMAVSFSGNHVSFYSRRHNADLIFDGASRIDNHFLAAGDYFHIKVSVTDNNEFLVEINDVEQIVPNHLNTPMSDIGWMSYWNKNKTIAVHRACYL